MAALIARHRLGRGQWLEVSLFDAVLQVLGSTQYQRGQPFVNFTPPATRSELPLIRRHLCADGRYVDISPPWRGVDLFAERFLPSALLDSGITHDKSPAATAEVARTLRELFQTRKAAEWELACQEAGTGIAVCQTTEEWLHDPHARDSGCVISLDDPELGPTAQAGYPVTLSKTPSRARGPRHHLGADQAVLREVATGQPSGPGAQEPATASPPAGLARALDGVRVVDAPRILAGPTACRVLAEYGAEVVKINNPRLEENPRRHHGPHLRQQRQADHPVRPEVGRRAGDLRRLLEQADVFHQNFAPATVDRLGISEAQLRRRRPDIVYSSVNTHAAGGSRSWFRGHEELGQALTGIETRFGGDGEPARVGWPVCDYATGHLSAFGILLALFHRLRTGEGQHVRASLSQSGTYLQLPFMLSFAGQVRREPAGLEAKGWGPLYRLYQASDRWLFVAGQQPRDRERLAQVEGLHGRDRVPEAELEAALGERFAQASVAVWVERLNAAGLSAQPARTVHAAGPGAARRLAHARGHRGSSAGGALR